MNTFILRQVVEISAIWPIKHTSKLSFRWKFVYIMWSSPFKTDFQSVEFSELIGNLLFTTEHVALNLNRILRMINISSCISVRCSENYTEWKLACRRKPTNAEKLANRLLTQTNKILEEDVRNILLLSIIPHGCS